MRNEMEFIYVIIKDDKDSEAFYYPWTYPRIHRSKEGAVDEVIKDLSLSYNEDINHNGEARYPKDIFLKKLEEVAFHKNDAMGLEIYSPYGHYHIIYTDLED